MRRRPLRRDPAREFSLNRIDEKIQERVGDLHSREHASRVLATQ